MIVLMAQSILDDRILVDEYGYTDSEGVHHCKDTKFAARISDSELVKFITSKIVLSTDEWSRIDIDTDL